MVSRRAVLAAGGTVIATSGAGCSALGGGASTGTKYQHWYGPEMADVQQFFLSDSEEVTGFEDRIWTAAVPEIRSNDHLETSMVDELSEHGAAIGCIAGSGQRENVDVRLTTSTTGMRLAVGSFDTDALADALPERAAHQETYGDHDLYTMELEPEYPNRGGLMGYAIGGDSVARTVGGTTDGTLDNAKAFLDTGSGEADRYVDTHETTGTFVEELGNGDWTFVQNLGTERPMGIRIDLDGDTAERTTVATFESEGEAAESNYASPGRVDVWRRTPENESRPRVNVGKLAPYENFEHSVDGRTVTMTGTIPTERLAVWDTRFP